MPLSTPDSGWLRGRVFPPLGGIAASPKAGGEPWPSLLQRWALLSPAAWPPAQWSAVHGAPQGLGRLLWSLAVRPHSK